MNLNDTIKTQNFRINHTHLQTATSTNTLLKEMAEKGAAEGTVLTAETQTAGRGRLNRSFYSPESGLYMSILLRPAERNATLGAEGALRITTAAAVAVCRAIETVCGRKCGIKWVNDIYADGKKLCGILVEGALIPGKAELDYAVLGIGVNIEAPKKGFPEEIKNVAGAIYEYGNAPQNTDIRTVLAAEIITEFSKIYVDSICGSVDKNEAFINEYRVRSVLNGKRIEIFRTAEAENGVAIGVNADCSLAVETDKGERLNLTYGEVRIKMKDQGSNE